MTKFNTLYRKFRIAAMAFVIAGTAIVGGNAFFNTNQAQAAGKCVDYVYSRGGVANCIINIQKIINASGVTTKIDTDGAFGPLTQNAVKAFQANRGIVADGIVGTQTWKKLCAVTQSSAAAPKTAAGCVVTTTPTPTPVAPTATDLNNTAKWYKIFGGTYLDGSNPNAKDNTIIINNYVCKTSVGSAFKYRLASIVTYHTNLATNKTATIVGKVANTSGTTLTTTATKSIPLTKTSPAVGTIYDLGYTTGTTGSGTFGFNVDSNTNKAWSNVNITSIPVCS